jgi:subtilisin family serine protease
MEARANLVAAAEIEDWQARGRAVYDGLRQVAADSQAPIIAYATERGLVYRSFFSNNSVYIEAGDLTAVQDLARMPGVALVRLPQVAQVLPDLRQAPEGEPTGPDAYGWNLDTLDPGSGLYGMQAAQVWDQHGVTGQNIVVANIDTGVFYQHISLDRQYRGNLSGNVGGPYEHDYNWYQPNFKPCGNGTYPCDADSYGHGTSTIGIMVAETPTLDKQLGVAPGARWIACQGCDDPPYCTEEALLGCADWMLAPVRSVTTRAIHPAIPICVLTSSTTRGAAPAATPGTRLPSRPGLPRECFPPLRPEMMAGAARSPAPATCRRVSVWRLTSPMD